MTTEANERVRAAMTWSVVLSALMIVIGITAIGLPFMAGVAIDEIIAWLLLFSGALHVAFAWRGHGPSGVLWEILLGLAYGVIGVYLLTRPLLGLASLTLAVAIYLFVEAMLEFVLWFQLRTTRGRGWLLFDGVVTVVLGVMIWRTWPSSATWVLGTLVGISMLFSGVSRLVLSLGARRLLT